MATSDLIPCAYGEVPGHRHDRISAGAVVPVHVYRAFARPFQPRRPALSRRFLLHVSPHKSHFLSGDFQDMPSSPPKSSFLSSTSTSSSPRVSTSSSSAQSTPNARLNQIKDHTMGSFSTEPIPTLFDENVVPQAPEDPLFGLMAAYRKDTFEKKVDLGIGAYRDNNAKPWVLPVVKKVR